MKSGGKKIFKIYSLISTSNIFVTIPFIKTYNNVKWLFSITNKELLKKHFGFIYFFFNKYICLRAPIMVVFDKNSNLRPK